MITAIFNPDTTMANAYGLWQWDYGQVLRIQGLHLPSMVEIHFSLQDTGGTSVMRVGITKDGVTDVVIPDSMLQNNGAASDYDIFAFVYLTDDTSGQTEYKIKLRVKSRPEPEVPSGGEDPNIFHEVVQAVRKSADKAAESEKQAEGWAHGREDLPERAQDNAKYYAGQAAADAKKTGTDRKEVERLVESVSGIDEQVVKVENLTKQAQTSATNAALSEQAAKTAETNAQNAQAGAETAEGNAELAERNAKASEQAVEKAKQLVTQMGQEVLDNKNHVDQTAQAFTLTAQQAVADVNNAGQTQTERVEGAGNDAVESVKTAQTAATKAVEAAKTEAVEAVQTEGTTQTRNVSAEGEKQVQAVQAAAQEIVADREQIAQNKADVTALKEDLGDLVEVIHSKNLLDASKLHNGFLQNSGVVSTADWALDYWYTDKIPCTKSDIVFANGTSNPQNQLGGLYKNGKWVASLSSNATISKTQDESEKAYYFKIIFSEACPDFDAIILNTLNLNDFEKKFVMLNCIEPDVYSQYDIYHTSKMISKDVEAQAITESLMDEIEQKINAKVPNVINCWGDSLTFGYGATDRNTETYPKVLQKLLGDSFTVNNYAVSGEGTQQIASRQGGTLAYVQPCTIPANGSVNITLKDLVGTSIFLLNQGDAGINPCYINGIKGTLSKDSSNIVFTRLENGDAVEIMHPVPLITDANKNARDGIIIIWCGSNNRTYFNDSPTIEKNEVHNIIRCIKTMIKHSNCGGKYIVIGLTSKAYMPQIEMVNKAFATEFGEHFLDVRNNILLSGLKESEITPVDQDNTDIENGEIPSSLRVDEIHFNTKGYALIAKYVYELGKTLGYWD